MTYNRIKHNGKRPAAIAAMLLSAVLCVPTFGQGYSPVAPTYLPAAPLYSAPQLSDEQMGDLTAAVALYPDPLLAAMLPAATYPSDVAAANQWLTLHPNPDELSIQMLPFQPSVKTLLHYPSVLSMMATHLDWTEALGAAFVYQQADLMNSIQRWRGAALAAGTLVSNREQQVVSSGGVILILPAVPETIYVPVYDPAIVYVRHREPLANAIRFSIGGRFGTWLDFDVDWNHHEVRAPARPWWERHDLDEHRRWDEIRRPAVVVTPDREQERSSDRVVQQEAPRERVQPAPLTTSTDERRVFVREPDKRPTYPDTVVTPQPGHKVVKMKPGKDNKDNKDQGRARD